MRHPFRQSGIAILIGLAVLLLAAVPALSDKGFTGKCVGVTDGDTVSVMRAGKAVKIRLHGIDAPESGQDFGTRARQELSSLVFGKEVRVDVRDTDRYGRLVADIHLDDGTRVNEVMVRRGMAWWYRQYAPRDDALKKAQADAQADCVGLWRDPHAIPPWEYRKQEAAASKPAKPSASSEAPRAPPPADPDAVVYVLKTGTRYHAAGCRYLSPSRKAITLEEAVAQGYTPCRVCGGVVSRN